MKHLIACLAASSFFLAAPVGLPAEACAFLAGNEATASLASNENVCGAPAESAPEQGESAPEA